MSARSEQPFDRNEFRERITRTQHAMSAAGVDVLVVADPANITYLTGYDNFSWPVQVVGVPDDKYGKELCAWIKVKPGAEPIEGEAARAFCDGRISRHKIPRDILNVDGFPMTVTGKIRKVEMREQTLRKLSEGAL